MDAAPWEGIWGFPLTPFGRHGVDLDLLAAGAAHQLRGGVDVLCACGVIAQVDRLDRDEHAASVRTLVEVAGDRIPVVATVIAGRDGARTAAAAVSAGARGLVVIPRSPRADAAARALRAVAAAAPGVPVALYHRPPLRLGGEQLQRLAEVPELSWVKDGHRDVRLFRQLAAAVDRLRWVSAWEDVALAFWAQGCSAFAPASSAYAPGYSVGWLGRLRDGDVAGARALLAGHAYPMVDLRLGRRGIDIPVVKAAMGAAGIAAGGTRPPAKRLTAPERARVEGLMATLPGLLAGVRRPAGAGG